jgi:hypothetical protein
VHQGSAGGNFRRPTSFSLPLTQRPGLEPGIIFSAVGLFCLDDWSFVSYHVSNAARHAAPNEGNEMSAQAQLLKKYAAMGIKGRKQAARLAAVLIAGSCVNK